MAGDWLACQVIAVWLIREYPIRGCRTLGSGLSYLAHCMPPDQQCCQGVGVTVLNKGKIYLSEHREVKGQILLS